MMKRVVWAALLLSVGCGSDSGEGSGGGALLTCIDAVACWEYTGNMWDETNVRSTCDSSARAFSGDACPTEGLIGKCRWNDPEVELINYYYADSGVSDPESECRDVLEGTWSPG